MAGLIDKRAFLAARSCITQGWYHRHHPASAPGPGLQWRFYAGTDVGRRARAWLGEGRNLPRAPLDAALQATSSALDSHDLTLLFEASFAWNGFVARADALRRSEDGWELIEIKSSKSTADGRTKADDLDDIAYTVCVAMNAGLPVVSAKLVLINREYTLNADVDLFTEIDVTGEALGRATDFSAEAPEIASAVAPHQRPEPSLKFACRKCEWFEVACVGKAVPDPLFAISRLSEKKFIELQPYERVSLIPDEANLTEIQQRVVDLIRSGRERVDETELGILDEVVWPAYYLDFETVMPYVPWFVDRPPYDAVPFQYSLHVLDNPEANPEHREYLAGSDGDWRRELTDRLLIDLGTTGSVVVYSSYEKTQLKALAALFPDLAGSLDFVIDRLFDLEKVFKGGYAHPGFAGSTSIKKVLPVMVPDLRYDDLDIGNGEDAAGVFGLMRVGQYPPDSHAQHREQLTEYCKLDTMAMVRLHEAVRRIRGKQQA
jgi:hypothetical protein